MPAKKTIKQKNKTKIIFRYSLISLGFFAIASIVAIKLFINTNVIAEKWNKAAEKQLNVFKEIDPERGDILADNGNILACNIVAYDIKLDGGHPRLMKMKKKPWKEIKQLGDSLDKYYPMVEDFDKLPPDQKEEKSWATRLRRQFELPDTVKHNHSMYILHKGSLEDFERIMSFPFAKRFAEFNGQKNPFYYTPVTKRIYPFGKMAELSIGRTNSDSTRNNKIHGYSGLERDLDDLLYGIPGKSQKIPLTAGFGDWTIEKPVRGYDVFTTINIDMQDMLEEELTRIMQETNSVWGTAILMEVATGDIKAISNVERMKDGTYAEALNRAVLGYEPGSVMKPISMMVAFEDGIVKSVNDVVDTSPFQGTTDPHAPSVKNMKQVIEMSSNTGIARILFRKYKDHPEKFQERLAEMGFFDHFNCGIHPETLPRFASAGPKDGNGNKQTMTARLLTLARHTYGYSSAIPPLYTLAMYNAIANDGKFVRPRLIKGLRDENGRDSLIPVSYIREQVCSPQTAEKVRQCLREVVVSKHGTGHILDDDRVAIAGKTGTAFAAMKGGGYDKSMRRLAFAGFFPYEKPKYSCMVLIAAPAGCGAARVSGTVLKNMALRLYSRGLLDNRSNHASENVASTPALVASDKADYKNIRTNTGAANAKRLRAGSDTPEGTVPDVRGYDAPTAVKRLETLGINVKLNGSGHVVAQSMQPGQKYRKGSTITLTLKI